MPVLIAYASRHGATCGIAERLADRLRADGSQVDDGPAAEVRDIAAQIPAASATTR